jgi:hypothetical protein
MFETFSRSWLLVKDSFQVLKDEKEIALFPVISAIASMLLFSAFVLQVLLSAHALGSMNEFWVYPMFFVYYLLSCFIVVFFNAGLITCANMRLNGKDPKFSDGIGNAARHVGGLFVWALISATVNVILRIVRALVSGKKKGFIVGIISGIILSVLEGAWIILTPFVVPVIVLEDAGPIDAIRESWELFKAVWGETLAGNFSIGAVFLLLGLLGIIPFVALWFLTGPYVVWVSVLGAVMVYWVVLAIIGFSLHGIFLTALYNYAKTGKIPEAYKPDVITGAFERRSDSRRPNVPS